MLDAYLYAVERLRDAERTPRHPATATVAHQPGGGPSTRRWLAAAFRGAAWVLSWTAARIEPAGERVA